ncbi:MAG: hypothetical protein L6R41_002469 [Letrouitia leprolyta]|nr:MAG: hypothetical protein L6R41_002469 [Letrouitia leprolyta]
MEPTADFEHPIHLLHAIWDRPFIAQYTKRAGFCQYADRLTREDRAKVIACNGGRDLLQASPQLDKALVSSKPKLRSQTGVPLIHHDKEVWHQRILAGESGPMITLLLTLLPNLRTLCLWDIWKYRREYLDSIMAIIAQDASDSSTSSPLPRALPLLKLCKVRIDTADDDSGTPLQVLASFLALPSIQEISGSHFEADYTAYKWPFSDHHVSSVEAVNLFSSAISAPNMQEFLSPLKNLKRFDYSHYCMGNGAGYSWDGGACLDAIVAEAATSLECLRFTISVGTSSNPLRTFQPLERLRRLDFSAELLAGYIEDNSSERRSDGERASHKLLGILPPSLEELTILTNKYPRDWKQFDEIFDDLNKGRRIPGFPKLFLVWLRCSGDTLRTWIFKSPIINEETTLGAWIFV